MKKYLTTIALIVSVLFAQAQTKDITKKETEIYTAVEKAAEYPGGMKAFYDYVTKNLKYPEKAKAAKVAGYVFIIFVVEKDGSLTDLKVLRGIDAELDAEAIRLVKLSGKWIPGKQNGTPVRSRFTLPISYKL